jgi:hypothetical protein
MIVHTFTHSNPTHTYSYIFIHTHTQTHTRSVNARQTNVWEDQAIGRLLRPGQTRRVQIWRFLALDTCEQTLFTEGVYSRRDRAAAKFKRDSEKEIGKEKEKESHL